MNKLLSIGLAALLFIPFSHAEEHASPKNPAFSFAPRVDALKDVELAQENAKQSNKLLLVVMGANWCHDSKGLVARFSNEAMTPIVAKRFETIFIDVGHFEDLHYIPQKFGYPAYFGTPTVLVVEPNSGVLLNRGTLPKWQSADSVSLSEFVEYFSEIDVTEKEASVKSEELTQFTHTQVARLKQAFDHLRPIWAAVRNKETTDKKQLDTVATEVWQFRSQLQKDINSLTDSLLKDPSVKLTLPIYDKFSWEG